MPRCSDCGYAVRLRKDGTVAAHRLYYGIAGFVYCEGEGKPPAEAANLDGGGGPA